MISSFILKQIYNVLQFITTNLRSSADVSLPANLTSAISTTNTYLSSIDFIFPVATFLTIFGLILGIETFIILFKIMNWVIRKIPGVN